MLSDSPPASDRTQAAWLERELLHSRRQLAELADLISHSPAVVFRWRVMPGGWLAEYVSENVRQFGYASEDFLSQRLSWTQVLHPEDAPRMRAEMVADIAQRRSHATRSVRILTADGRVRHLEGHDHAIFDEYGTLTHVESLFLDITERIQAEQELRASEEKHRALIHCIPAITYQAALDPENPVYFVSPQVETFLGYTQEECFSHPYFWWERMYPDDRERVCDAMRHCRATGEPLDIEYRMRRRDGSLVWFHDKAAVRRDDAGAPVALEGVMLDITAQKEAEQALRDSEQRFSTLFEFAPVPIAISEWPSRRILYINRRFEEVSGFTREEAIGKTSAGLGLWDADAFAQSGNILAQDGEIESREFTIRTKTGETLNCLFFAKRVDIGGQQYYFIAAIDITDHRAAQRELEASHARMEAQVRERTALLRESEARLAGVLEHTHMLVALLDADFNFLWVNRAYAEEDGYDPSFYVGKNHFALYPDDENRALFRRVVETGEPCFMSAKPFVYPAHPERGVTYWDWSLIPVADERGRVTSLVFTLAEVTTRVAAERALRESETNLRQAEEIAHVGYWERDPRAQTLRWSEEVFRIFGLPPAPAVSMADFLGAIHPDDRAAVARHIEDTERAGSTSGMEFRIVRPTGQIRVVANLARVERDATGQAVKVFGVLQDITERRVAEDQLEALLRNVERWAAELDTTVGAIADGIIIYNADLEIVRINDGARAMFGYTPEVTVLPVEQRRTRRVLRALDGHPMPEERLPVRRALHGEVVRGEMMEFVWPDGRALTASVSAAPIHDADGELLGVVATFTDVTELHALQQRQEDLLRIVSHDLRIPLTVIGGHMQLVEAALAKHPLDGKLNTSIHAIRRGVQRMDVMISDLVDLARLESGQCILCLQPLNLDLYIVDLLQRLRGPLAVNRVTVDLPPTLPPMLADHDRLERILANLLSNALKYSPADAPVRLCARHAGNALVIEIIDQGVGISAHDLPHLFERFYRAKSERKAEGLGLGLYITKMLVEAHGGRIEAHSAPGQGSTFRVTLPLA